MSFFFGGGGGKFNTCKHSNIIFSSKLKQQQLMRPLKSIQSYIGPFAFLLSQAQNECAFRNAEVNKNFA